MQESVGNGVRGVLDRLLETSTGLSRKQRVVFDFLRENPVASASLTVEQLAERLHINASTVVRTAKSLGYEGYGELKRDLRYTYLHGLTPLDQFRDHQNHVSESHLVVAQLHADLQNVADLVEDFDLSTIERLAAAILDARRTLVLSSGSYAALGHVLVHQARFIGVPIDLEMRGSSFVIHQLSQLREDDLVIGIGFWRGPREVVKSIEWARDHGFTTAAITDNRRGRLARAATHLLTAPSESTSYFQSLTAGMALVYALINALWMGDPERAERGARLAQQLYIEFGVTADAD